MAPAAGSSPPRPFPQLGLAPDPGPGLRPWPAGADELTVAVVNTCAGGLTAISPPAQRMAGVWGGA
ncbi:hypothetical protein, partial [Streptomyces rhizosphaericus]|uniref:hypothetical protein n=1 Tax=Streptomyces rhizosphaericus TaxID=114699 RepID=UPI001ABFE286